MVLFMTPLFLALVTIEFADLIFAVDSVPAIFAITTDTFIVYTSNVFAILGLRALFFALSAMIERFAYLKYAPRPHPDFHRLESLPDRDIPLGEIPGQRFARRHDRAAGGRRAVLAL